LKNDNVQGEYYITDLVKLAFSENQKIETVSIDPHEALGANSKAELGILETMLKQKNS
jgi:bifunctional UDP-N-acetylglucosamine pyrophosphorylase/glucosamine-1-phosphate N-acetyltransferase